MTDMVERVAQAMWFAHGQPDEFATYADDMREPTEAMIEAADDYNSRAYTDATDPIEARGTWNVMIVAALKARRAEGLTAETTYEFRLRGGTLSDSATLEPKPSGEA